MPQDRTAAAASTKAEAAKKKAKEDADKKAKAKAEMKKKKEAAASAEKKAKQAVPDQATPTPAAAPNKVHPLGVDVAILYPCIFACSANSVHEILLSCTMAVLSY